MLGSPTTATLTALARTTYPRDEQGMDALCEEIRAGFRSLG